MKPQRKESVNAMNRLHLGVRADLEKFIVIREVHAVSVGDELTLADRRSVFDIYGHRG